MTVYVIHFVVSNLPRLVVFYHSQPGVSLEHKHNYQEGEERRRDEVETTGIRTMESKTETGRPSRRDIGVGRYSPPLHTGLGIRLHSPKKVTRV